MKIKLDENLGPTIAKIFRDAGHDVYLVREQGLGGREDSVLIEVCRAEGRCLVTLDLDFGTDPELPADTISRDRHSPAAGADEPR